MNFAINYSPASVQLLESGKITLDYFKCPDWEWMISEASAYLPVAVHFDLAAGDGRAGEINWGHIWHCLEVTGTPYLNLHLESKIKDFTSSLPLDTVEPAHRRMVYDQVLRDIEMISQHIPTERIILENVPYRGLGGKILRPSVEAEIIHRLLETSGCGFLFDLPHARISAHYLGMTEQEYISQLPMQRIREMHFTGMEWIDGKLTDHLGASEPDWFALEWVFAFLARNEIPRPWLLAFEYGGVGEKFEWRSDPDVIAAQMPRLAAY